MRKLVLFLFLFSVFWLTACESKKPQIELELTNFDFGDVVNGEIVSREIKVRNTGSTDLVVSSVMTTCGCTTASLQPMTIPAGGEAALQITFDSGAHGPDLTGEVMRRVILASNDLDSPEFLVDFVANILAPQ